jgi:hypothetical protein
MNTKLASAGLVLAFAAGFLVRGAVPGEPVAYAQGPKVWELRTYTVPDKAKLDLLHKRFKDHSLGFFKRHNMQSIWFGKTIEAPLNETTMVYMLGFPSREAAKKSWDEFRADEGWTAVAKESGVGPVKIESVFLEPTDYSPMK